MRKKLWAIASSVAILALLVFYVGLDDSEFVIAAALPIALMMIPALNPRLRELVLRRAKATRAIGIVVVIAAAVGLFGVVSRSQDLEGFDLPLALVLAAFGGGLMLVFFPSSLQKVQTQVEIAAPDPSSRGSWSNALAEIGACWSVMRNERSALLRIGFPYLLLTLVSTVPMFLAYGRLDELSRTEAIFVLLPLLLNLLVWPGLPLAWCRYLVTGGPPKVISAPYMAFWSFTWRIFLLNSIAGRFEEMAGGRAEELAAAMSIPVPTLELLLTLGITAGTFWVAAPMALVLPAIASGAPKLGIAGSVRGTRATEGYLIGALGVAAPFWIVCLAVGNIPEGLELSVVLGATLAGAIATVLGIIAFSTYISRAYLRAAASEALPVHD